MRFFVRRHVQCGCQTVSARIYIRYYCVRHYQESMEQLMSDLHFVAGEFLRLASTARDVAEVVRTARPEGGASAFASAMPGADLMSLMQSVEEACADKCATTGKNLDNHGDSLDAAEKDFLAAEDGNGQVIGSIMNGPSFLTPQHGGGGGGASFDGLDSGFARTLGGTKAR